MTSPSGAYEASTPEDEHADSGISGPTDPGFAIPTSVDSYEEPEPTEAGPE